MQEKENILKILEDTKKAIKDNDIGLIISLSDRTINTASRTQDPDNIAVAVIVYSLGKILKREKYRELQGWQQLHKTIISSIDNSIRDLKKDNIDLVRRDLEEIRKSIGKLSGRLKKYIQDVFRKASINKASKIYEHGISLERTANLLGVTIWELANYAGQTEISDSPFCKTCDVKSRIKLAMEMFSG